MLKNIQPCNGNKVRQHFLNLPIYPDPTHPLIRVYFETHSQSKFHGNPFSRYLCNPADKPTNERTRVTTFLNECVTETNNYNHGHHFLLPGRELWIMEADTSLPLVKNASIDVFNVHITSIKQEMIQTSLV